MVAVISSLNLTSLMRAVSSFEQSQRKSDWHSSHQSVFICPCVGQLYIIQSLNGFRRLGVFGFIHGLLMVFRVGRRYSVQPEGLCQHRPGDRETLQDFKDLAGMLI
jgi:hypothetical protein